MADTFSTWLTKEIERRGWTVREAARRGKLAHGTLNNVLNEVTMTTTLDTYRGIARALGVPVVDVLEAAGEIPARSLAVPEEGECLGLFRTLPQVTRQALLSLLRSMTTERGALTFAERETQKLERAIVELPEEERALVEAMVKRLRTTGRGDAATTEVAADS